MLTLPPRSTARTQLFSPCIHPAGLPTARRQMFHCSPPPTWVAHGSLSEASGLHTLRRAAHGTSPLAFALHTLCPVPHTSPTAVPRPADASPGCPRLVNIHPSTANTHLALRRKPDSFRCQEGRGAGTKWWPIGLGGGQRIRLRKRLRSNRPVAHIAVSHIYLATSSPT